MDFLKRHSLVIGLLLMFLFTWPIDLANSGVMPFQVPFIVYLLLGYGFVVASLLMTGLTLGRGAVVALLKRFLIWRVGWQWYLAALLIYPGIMLASILANAAITQTPLDFSGVFAHRIFGASASLPLFVLPFLLVDALTNGEEIGWRGYVLPRLQKNYTALVSSLIVGVIWGLWHYPKFLAPGNTSPFGWFMVRIIADAVVYTWVYNNTKGSLLLVTLLHAASNTAGVFLPVSNTVAGGNQLAYLIQIGLEVLAAILVVVAAGPVHLSRTAARQVQA